MGPVPGGGVLEVVAEDLDLRFIRPAGGRLGRGGRRRVAMHLGRQGRLVDLDAVRRGEALGPDQVQARLVQRAAQVPVVARRGQHRRLDGEVEARHLVDADAGHGLAVERGSVGHQIGRLVVDAAVEMDAALIERAGEVERARHPVGVAEHRRVLHVAERADFLAHLPADAGRVVPGSVGQVDQLPEDVGQRLVDGARLVVVEELRGEVGDPVRQLVADHVVDREALAVDHLRAVPERVFERAEGGVGAPADRRVEREPGAVQAVEAEAVEEEVVGVAGELVGVVDVGLPGRAVALRAVERRRARIPVLRRSRRRRSGGRARRGSGRCARATTPRWASTSTS